MTATQRQRRRNTQGNVNTFTGAEGEFIYATDTHRISVHDGVKQGGFPIPNAEDIQSGAFTYSAAGGSANAIAVATASNPPALVAGLQISVRIATDNTGAATLQWGGLAARPIKKFTAGVKGDVVAGDLQAGEIPTFIYDGTDYVVTTAAAGGGRLLAYQVFTSSGTWNRPTGCNAVKVIVTGGGGGSMGSGFAGEPPAATGGTSSFGGFCSASGGVGGSQAGPSGNGGIGSGGNINIRGGAAFAYDLNNNFSSIGGASFFSTMSLQNSGAHYGKGADSGQAGSGGGTAIRFITSGIPSSVFVTVGAGGSPGGSLGGGEGGNAGVVIVEAYS